MYLIDLAFTVKALAMAELHITPNPIVIAAQAGIFLANFVVVKKLILNPYLKVRDLRDKLTLGNREEAAATLGKCDSIAKQIEEKLVASSSDAKKLRDDIRTKATAESSDFLAAAEKDARSVIDAVQKDVAAEVTSEKAKIPDVVKRLTDEVFTLAVT